MTHVPPQDLDLEAAVLSACMLSADALDNAADVLRPEHLYSDANRLIYAAALELHAAGAPADAVAISAHLRQRGQLERCGGTAYVAQLLECTPATRGVARCARIIREKWRLRELIGTCQRIAAEGYGQVESVQDFVDDAERAVFEIARSDEASPVRLIGEAVKDELRAAAEAAKHPTGVTGLSTGLVDLDKKTTGLQPGNLYVVAGRPGMGKTALVLQLSLGAARAGVALFFSLEMPRNQLAARVLSSEARVDLTRLRTGRLNEKEWSAVADAAGKLGHAALHIDDTPAVSLLEVRSRVRRLQARTRGGGSLALVAVDYLQLMRGRSEHREQEISELSRGLKQLAKEAGVPVIALSQLNRSVEMRNDKRPQLSDLRESGAIEQDADAVLFIYRDDYYREDSPDRGTAEIIIAKQRNGPTGRVLVKFTPEWTRFDNLYNGEDYAA